ncbi:MULTISPECIES: EVE domain-containing protein [Psychrobacter]|uniref:EVE domain-containing protein n=1 Tax=Psychrobacter glaciei TaxID=619771 RepID=A0ABQ3GT32_9GAMM|nr:MULTISPECIES: EVE domain-containing protein [Psychrobacter]MBP3945797.1 EVE domain-containing protein [Psychrobacter sp. K31L]GHD33815.1 EVE domain-containing protein [Psychrobacter glaciei]
MAYWLMKSNPKFFSIQDLQRLGTEGWDGVRNYRARNFMRDHMQVGDKVFFYHSSAKPSGVAGIMTVSQAGYPDPTQFHPEHRHYDPIATEDEPRWYMVDVTFEQAFIEVLPLLELKFLPALEDSLLLRKGCQQLTVIPLEPKHWQAIIDMAETLDLISANNNLAL